MKRRNVFVLSGVAVAMAACFGSVYRFLQEPKFGALPSDTSAFQNCSHFYDGIFHNTLPTPILTDDTSFIGAFAKSLITQKTDPEPLVALPATKVDINQISRTMDIIIWLGHSSFYIQLAGKRILIDPVLSNYASPVSFSTKAFAGSNPYQPKDFPDIDVLIVSHDHWDHLDYPTIIALKDKLKNIICPLGVDAHFLRWGFEKKILHPLDWNQSWEISENLIIHCLEARHYSGRTLEQNKTFWASYMVRSNHYKIFFSGDTGYGPHFKDIGTRFGNIDLVLLDSGQYNERWRYIHMNPDEALNAASDLRAQNFIPAHIGKFCISMHPWYEPFERLSFNADKKGIRLITPRIGLPLNLSKTLPIQEKWWETAKLQAKTKTT